LRHAPHTRRRTVQDGGGLCIRDQLQERPECVAPAIAVSQFELAADVLAPMMLLPDANVTWRHAPWAAKDGRAFFRGVPSCGELRLEPGVCGRTWVARLAQQRPDVLDAGARGRGDRLGLAFERLRVASAPFCGQRAPRGATTVATTLRALS
jgi:hypothetical protein